jgi:hypothetical protein
MIRELTNPARVMIRPPSLVSSSWGPREKHVKSSHVGLRGFVTVWLGTVTRGVRGVSWGTVTVGCGDRATVKARSRVMITIPQIVTRGHYSRVIDNGWAREVQDCD